jgi:uncharacterized protein
MTTRMSFMRKNTTIFTRWFIFFIGLLVMALGIALMIRADYGSAPWDVLHIGLYKRLGLTIGTWSIIVGIIIIAVTSFITKKPPQLGAFLNMLFVGIFIDLYLLLPFLTTPLTTFGKIIMLLIGIVIMGYGIGLYIAANCGAGPRDSLMLALTDLLGWKVQWIRGTMEVVVLVAGWLLGGPVFIGTIIFSVCIGWIVGFTLPQCKKVVLEILNRGEWDEDINKGTLRINNYDGISKEVR